MSNIQTVLCYDKINISCSNRSLFLVTSRKLAFPLCYFKFILGGREGRRGGGRDVLYRLITKPKILFPDLACVG